MKNLRQMLRSTGLFGSRKRSPRPQRDSNRKRRLLGEALERRELLAGDVFLASNPMHNGFLQNDVNDDLQVTTIDALMIVNALNGAQGEEPSGAFYDTNNDGKVSSADALKVVNGLDGEGAGELFQLELSARGLDDTPLPVNGGVVEVDVNEQFFLEVAYVDARPGFGAATGAFQLITDLGVSSNGVLKPVLTEFQRLTFDTAIRDATSGSYVFSIENSATTYTANLSALQAGPNAFPSEVGNALEAFGYNPDQFEVSVDLGSAGDPIVVDIKYTDYDTLGNEDLPNISVADSLNIAAPVTLTEFAPFNTDGSVNSDAIRFNLFTNSRTYNGGEDLYATNNSGNFNDTDTSLPEGFYTVGGLAGEIPANGGGIPELSDDGSFEQPFDAFSLRVFLDEAITGFQVDVKPGTQVVPDPSNMGATIVEDHPEAILLYGRDDAFPADMVGLDNATVTFNAITVGGGNNNPTVSQALAVSVTEEAASVTQDLLQFANDTDGDSLNVSAFTNTSGNDAGVTLSGNSVTINPSNAAYDSLNDGDSEVIVFSYNINDGNGGSVAQTLTVTVNGVTDNTNRAPTVSAPVAESYNEDDQPAFVNLLDNAMDPDSDNLTVSNIMVTSGDSKGIVPNATAGRLSVTPQDYGGDLVLGQSEVVTYSYTISDGEFSINQTATVTIVGADDAGGNTAPDAGAPVNRTFTEDAANGTVDLLANASDVDPGDVLTATATLASGDDSGVTINGNNLTVTPNSYNSLKVGESTVVTYNVSISDGTASDTTTAVVTITGVNDAPVVSGAISESFLTTAAASTIQLLTNASDVDGDTLSVSNASIAGDQSGLSITGNVLSVNPSQYTSLAAGDSTTATVSYQVIDGNGGSVDQTATITITAPNAGNSSPTVSGPVSATAAETAAGFNVDLRDNASDNDNDALNVSGLTLQSGDDSGVTVNGNILAIDPSAYSALNSGQSEVITYIYNVIDGNGGSVAQTATVTITGVDAGNTIVISGGAVTRSISEDAAQTSVNLLTGASDTSGATLNVAGLTLNSGDDTGITVNGNTLTINPNAYNSLNAGQSEVIRYSYSVTNGTNSVSQTAVITVIGANDGTAPGSTVSGTLYIDHIENFPEVTQGAAPERNGVKDADEPGLGGVAVSMTSAANQNSSGVAVSASLITDLNGSYSFTNVAPGTYTITYDVPDGVVFTGVKTEQVVIGASGGAALSGPALGAISLGGALSNLDILASSYLTANQSMSLLSDSGAQGGQVVLDSSGNQELFVASLGLAGIRFAEVALNAQQDAALLTVIENDGTIKSARLSSDHFVLGHNGGAIQFFGGLEDFDFAASPSNLITQEFATYRNAIDKALSEGI